MEPFRSANSTVTCLRSPSRASRELRIFSTRWIGVYDSGGRSSEGRGPVSRPGPHQHLAVLVGRHALRVDELGLDILEVLVVEREPALQRAVGHALLAAQQLVYLRQDSSNVIVGPRIRACEHRMPLGMAGRATVSFQPRRTGWAGQVVTTERSKRPEREGDYRG